MGHTASMVDVDNSRAMRFVIDVSAAPSVAWALISDIGRHAEWSPQEFEATKETAGSVGVGSRYRTAGRKGARKGVLRTTEVVVTAFEPTRSFAFESTERAGVYRTTFHIEPSGSGSRIERVVQPPMHGLVSFIRHGLLAPVVRRYVQQNMDSLQVRLDEMTPDAL